MRKFQTHMTPNQQLVSDQGLLFPSSHSKAAKTRLSNSVRWASPFHWFYCFGVKSFETVSCRQYTCHQWRAACGGQERIKRAATRAVADEARGRLGLGGPRASGALEG